MKKQQFEIITAKTAAERLHMDRTNVLKAIKRGKLTARLVTEAPRPYWNITVDDKFLVIEKARSQSQN